MHDDRYDTVSSSSSSSSSSPAFPSNPRLTSSTTPSATDSSSFSLGGLRAITPPPPAGAYRPRPVRAHTFESETSQRPQQQHHHRTTDPIGSAASTGTPDHPLAQHRGSGLDATRRHPQRLIIPCSTEAGPSSLPAPPSRAHPSSTSSSITTTSNRRRHAAGAQPSGLIVDSSPVDVSSRLSFDESSIYTSSRSPITPVGDSSTSHITRRRLSNPASPRAAGAASRRNTITQSSLSQSNGHGHTHGHAHGHGPTDGHSSSNSKPSSPRPARAWASGGLFVPVQPKINKSDDEREEYSDDGGKQTGGYFGKRKKWLEMPQDNEPPRISMTPPSAMTEQMPFPAPVTAYSLQPSPLSAPFGLPPLPQDPNNILPLSLPGTPLPSPPISRHNTPFHTPHPSFPDLQAEYAFSTTSAGPSGSSGSPRTSISTSSSRAGWTHNMRSSDSRSSEDDEAVPYVPHHPRQSWWWNNAHDVPVSPKITTTTSSGRTLRGKFVPTGTRNWGWVYETWCGVTGRSSDLGRGGKGPRYARNREKDRLMAGYTSKRRSETVFGSKLLAKVVTFLPTSPTSILAFLLLFGVFAMGLTMTLCYILNPDKAPLPWRQYCTSDYPTLYSLQETGVASDFSFGYSNPLELAPLTSEHAAWPYHPHSEQPFTAEANWDLSELAPVGVFVGVFTMDSSLERRNMIRQSYASHWRSRKEGTEGVRVRFVMGRPRKKFVQAVQLEMEAFDDILLLDIPENMNSGKTHAFFSWAAENATVPRWEYPVVEDGADQKSKPSPVWTGEAAPQYVVKADDDSFIMLGELERRLRVAPRTKAYWGYLVKNQFMAGECYALSKDLVDYIASSPALRSLTRGKEDKLVSQWMKMHPEKQSIIWATDKCWMYDHPKAGTVYSHGFLYPSEVERIRAENVTGLSSQTLALRGGKDVADTYSTVSRFGTTYRPYHNDMTATEKVEALVEGSPLSRLRDERSRGQAAVEPLLQKVSRLYGQRPTRAERFLHDEQERGGTVVVHYIKKPEWFIETMVAMLGTADEQAVWHRGVGNGLGLLERRKGRVVSGKERESTGVHLGKDAGL